MPLGAADDKVLVIDLNRTEEIKSIVLYGEITGEPEIFLSQDAAEWKRVTPILESSKKSPLRIVFKEPRLERYIKVKTSKAKKLYLDELEVYKAF